jgi:hypothetical protein
MSDSIKKWHETSEEHVNRIISEGHKTQAYQILVEYPKEAILEAARILRSTN